MQKIKAFALLLLASTLVLIGFFFYNFNDFERGLTQKEIVHLTTIFNEEMDYSVVRINTANLPPTMAAMVLGNNILFREEYYVEDFSKDYLKMARLVHEACHVWANQTKGIYTSLLAASEHLFYGEKVYFHNPIKDNQTIHHFRFEQQCRIFSDYYIKRHLEFEIFNYKMLLQRSFENTLEIESNKRID